ncbi:glycosyltransferase family 2 protein [Ilyobacter polytropus]|uniref:Glycosyl transferase family 2 n=1 Tax=Ilyobacter polytropus (strain ATCC 51220 / DSM 2926 / LMG 16218 / CuHBu1) TaxID=572544 RepID=E3H7M0_ILYPC|nr:glycosyltransferase family 2 protein [Ilyobacter polytropus]ADO82602.1 glycosyl transferase family 2 [Ilyobacter polytropus DSM 2926]
MNIEKNDIFKYKNNFKKYSHVKSWLNFGDPNYKSKPHLTIAIPTYKRPEMLKEAIDSALNQKDFDDYEIIVVDNDSECISKISKTEELIKSYNNPKILYYKNDENLGIYGNWNRCIELARGKWYTMLHDDDLLLEDFLKEVFKLIKNTPEISCVKARHYIYDQRIDAKKKKFKEKLKNLRGKVQRYNELDFLISNPIGGPVGIVMEREKAVAIGGFNEEYYPSSDYVFFTNYCTKYNIYYYNKVLCFYRISKNESLNNGTMIKATRVHYDVINILRGKNNFRNFFFKEYSLYFSLRALKEIKSLWRVEVKKEEMQFLGDNPRLNPLVYYFYFIFKGLWILKRSIPLRPFKKKRTFKNIISRVKNLKFSLLKLK